MNIALGYHPLVILMFPQSLDGFKTGTLLFLIFYTKERIKKRARVYGFLKAIVNKDLKMN